MILVLCIFVTSYTLCSEQISDCYPRSIFVPRQLSYNPIYENALTLHKRIQDSTAYVSYKPIYTQSVGNRFKQYFTPHHLPELNVQEDGSGDIDSLWFKVISSDSTFYTSTLSLCPVRQTYGALLYGICALPCNFLLSVTTALIGTTNTMRVIERNIENVGTATGFPTVKKSLISPERLYGKIGGQLTKIGVDDIQVKLLYHLPTKCTYTELYALLGIPTGAGSYARYLF